MESVLLDNLKSKIVLHLNMIRSVRYVLMDLLSLLMKVVARKVLHWLHLWRVIVYFISKFLQFNVFLVHKDTTLMKKVNVQSVKLEVNVCFVIHKHLINVLCVLKDIIWILMENVLNKIPLLLNKKNKQLKQLNLKYYWKLLY